MVKVPFTVFVAGGPAHPCPCDGCRWVMKALDVMQVSNRKAAEIFMRYGATACTDVTGKQ